MLTFNSSGLRFEYDNRRSYIFKSDKPQKDASVEVSQVFSHCSACEKNVCGYSDNRMVQLLCRAELNLLNSKIPASPLQGLNHQPWDSKLSKPLSKPFSLAHLPFAKLLLQGSFCAELTGSPCQRRTSVSSHIIKNHVRFREQVGNRQSSVLILCKMKTNKQTTIY